LYSLSACITVAISTLAAATLDSPVRLSSLGTTSAARTPMMTTTTMISISVKPRALRRGRENFFIN
jgi:hypothetical protein